MRAGAHGVRSEKPEAAARSLERDRVEQTQRIC